MNAADKPATSSAPQRFNSLRSKVFFPFFMLLTILCALAIVGIMHISEHSYENSADQRLIAAQEVLFREFKKQEIVLQTYAVLMQQFQALSDRIQDESEVGILQDRLFNTLAELNISTAFYPPDIRGMIEQDSLVFLFDQARRSGKSRFRYTNEFGGIPVLMVATPIIENGETVKILLLKTTMGDNFLHEATSSLGIEAALLALDGNLLARSSQQITPLDLTPEQIADIGTGNQLSMNHDAGFGEERHLVSMIPLGSSDLVLLSLQASLEGASDKQNEAILQMTAIMLGIVILGTITYFRKVSKLTQPVRDLKHAAEAISRGNLNYRIVDISDDELGQIAVTFNQMAKDLESSYQERASQDIANALAHEEARTKQILDKKQIERDRLNDELSVIQRESSALYQLNQAMTSSIEIGALFDRILQVLNEILACDHIVLLVHNQGDSQLEVVRTAGIDTEVLSEVRFSMSQGVTGEAAHSQKMIYIKDIDEDTRNLSYHGKMVTRGSMISSPLIIKGRLVGVLNLHKKKVDAFSPSELRLIIAVSNQAAIAIDNAQLLEKSRESSNTDDLTGLSNRRHFQEILKREVAQARRFSSNFSIVMCDIDSFKKLKSTLGPYHSDALLRQVGQLLLKTTRGIDLVSRFGNDQFIILLPKTNKKGAIAAAEKLRNAVSNENFTESIHAEEDVNITVSFGATEFPADSKNIYELLNLADRALYAAKKDGGNCSVAWEGPAPGPE